MFEYLKTHYWITRALNKIYTPLWENNKENGLPWWLSGKESACNAGDRGDVGSIPRLGRSPEGGNGNPLKYSCLENPMDNWAWWATVYKVAKSQMQLSDWAQQQQQRKIHAKTWLMQHLENYRFILTWLGGWERGSGGKGCVCWFILLYGRN